MSLPQAFVVGTAGHIDHGKSSLVHALTGHDPDSLPEEKRRGITINLGFAHMTLADGRVVSFVDVPGHERLVRTMIAGAAGVDAVLFCVSASEGVMPQTREHLDILKLLGVERGVVALTMADLVDEEMLELAMEDVNDALEGSFLEHAPRVVTSAQDGQGLDALRKVLAELPLASRSVSGPFRLPVDRSFVQKGFGVVVTGTVISGQVRQGQELTLLPKGDTLRVRSIQVHGELQPTSQAGLRTAINLSGAEREELPRGSVLVGPGVHGVQILDARYQHLAGAPALKAGTRVRLLAGTSEVMAILDPLDGPIEPDSSRLVQIRCATPVAVLPGDRFVLRRESPVTTLGGGTLLDVWAPRHRSRDHQRATAELLALEAGDSQILLTRAGPAGLPTSVAAERGLEGQNLADRVLASTQLQLLRSALLDSLDQVHQEQPLVQAIGRRTLHRGRLAALGPQAFDALLKLLEADGEIQIQGPRLCRAGWGVQLSQAQRAVSELLVTQVKESGLQAPTLRDLSEKLSTQDAQLLTLLLESERLIRVGERVYLSHDLEQLSARVLHWLDANQSMSPPDFKELTGLSRRYAIPLLEWLDAQGVTQRQGETRVRASR